MKPVCASETVSDESGAEDRKLKQRLSRSHTVLTAARYVISYRFTHEPCYLIGLCFLLLTWTVRSLSDSVLHIDLDLLLVVVISKFLN